MDRHAWNERYAARELVWGALPNRLVESFVKAHFAERTSAGRALDLACGEGRNAIWLAKRGWRVSAVDFSEVAIERARGLAAREGVEVEWIHADVAAYAPERAAFTLVLVSYLQVPAPERQRVLARAAEALAPGGALFMIGHARRNLRDGVGGPSDPAVLWDPGAIAAELRSLGLAVARCEEVRRPLDASLTVPSAIDLQVEAWRPSDRAGDRAGAQARE